MKKIVLILTTMISLLSSCSKMPITVNRSPFDEISSQLIIDWTDAQLRLIRNTTGVTHVAFSRHFSYTGIALYESLVNSDNRKKSIVPYLNGNLVLPALPNGNHVFFPLAANSAYADMFRFFYTGKESNLSLIDSLEAEYRNRYINEATSNFSISESIRYGKEIAAAVIEWSKQDGASNANIPYTPLGEGFWEPTAPAYAAANVPGWGNNRTIVAGSINNTTAPVPAPFSTDPASSFYNMVKQLYDISQTLTGEQKVIANYWDDAPNGKYVTVFGHWFSILKQVLQKENLSLIDGAEAYMRLGVTMNESAISCWKSKYSFNQLRPITYIRKYMGHGDWSPLITTPPHPEYLAAHATLSSSAAYALETVFGKNYAFTDHTYESIGMPARFFSSFESAADEAGFSRLLGGIHYMPSIEAGKTIGRKVGENVKSILITLK